MFQQLVPGIEMGTIRTPLPTVHFKLLDIEPGSMKMTLIMCSSLQPMVTAPATLSNRKKQAEEVVGFIRLPEPVTWLKPFAIQMAWSIPVCQVSYKHKHTTFLIHKIMA
jgi:hypothetical protein